MVCFLSNWDRPITKSSLNDSWVLQKWYLLETILMSCSMYALAENYFSSMFQEDEHIHPESTISFQRSQPLSSKIGFNSIDIDSPALGLSYWLMLGQPFHSIFIFLDCTLEVTDASNWLCGEHRGLTLTFLGHCSDDNVELASVDLTWSLHLSDADLFFPAFGNSPLSIY